MLIIGLICETAACVGQRQPVTVPVPVYCTVKDPAPPDLGCPPLQTQADVIRCFEANDTARDGYEANLRRALAACRAPQPAPERKTP